MAELNSQDRNCSGKNPQPYQESFRLSDLRMILGWASIFLALAYLLAYLLVGVAIYRAPDRDFTLVENILIPAWLAFSIFNKFTMVLGRKHFYLSLVCVLLWAGMYLVTGSDQAGSAQVAMPIGFAILGLAVMFGYPLIDFVNVFLPMSQARQA